MKKNFAQTRNFVNDNSPFVTVSQQYQTYDLWELIISINPYIQKGILESLGHCRRRLLSCRPCRFYSSRRANLFLSRASVTKFAQMLTGRATSTIWKLI